MNTRTLRIDAFPMRDSKGDLWRAAKSNRPTRPSEGELADRFAERHSSRVRFLAAAPRDGSQQARKAQWVVWSAAGEEWLLDALNVAQRLAREICREAAEECNDPAIDGNRYVSGVLSLAKCDPRLAAGDWPLHPEVDAA